MVATITTAVGGLSVELLAVSAAGLGIGVAIYGLKRGWSLVRGFAKG